jgi:hypothetical protein
VVERAKHFKKNVQKLAMSWNAKSFINEIECRIDEES